MPVRRLRWPGDRPGLTTRRADAADPSRRRRSRARPATPSPGERRLAHPPSDRYRAAEAAAAAAEAGGDAIDPAASVARGVAIALAVAIVGCGRDRRPRWRAVADRPVLVVVAGATGGRRRHRAALGRGRPPGAASAGRHRRRRWRSARSPSASSACGSTAGREGGVLGPLDYLGEVFGPLVLVEFAAAGVVAWLAAR